MAVNIGGSNVVYAAVQVGRKLQITRPIGYPSTISTGTTATTEGSGGGTNGESGGATSTTEGSDGATSDTKDSYGESKANGFEIIGDKSIGKFVDKAKAGKNSVIYEHLKSGQQIIRYTGHSILTVTFYLVVDGITIHDHASIAMGGPAYATYFTEIAKDAKDKEEA